MQPNLTTSMKHTLTILTTLLLSPFAVLHAQSSQTDAAGVGYAVASRLEEFLGEPLFVPMQQLWEKRGGWGGVLTAKDGTVVAFQSPGGGNCRRSRDGGKTWDADIDIAPDAKGGRALVDETKGDIFYVNPAAGWLFRSCDSGATWTRESVQVRPDGFGNIPKTEGVAAMQCGITLAFGKHKGRLLMPARVMGRRVPTPSSGGPTTTAPRSTATTAAQSGRPASRSPCSALARRRWRSCPTAASSTTPRAHEPRQPLPGPQRRRRRPLDRRLPQSRPADGARGTSYGLMGGMIRLPVPGHDILLYSNVDTDAGVMPKQVGASIATGREKATVWASFDGGRTWPVKRLVYDGPVPIPISAWAGTGRQARARSISFSKAARRGATKRFKWSRST